MNKMGFFFTTIAIALSLVIIVSYNVYTGYRLKDEMEAIEIRIETINNFIKDIEDDFENAIIIIGTRSLFSIEDYLMANNNPSLPPKFLDDLGTSLSAAFDEVFQNGTINSEKMSIMQNNTLSNWINNTKIQANKTGIILDFSINIDDVTIGQSEPWKVDISVDLAYDVQDKKNIVSWTINKVFTNKINITGLNDPLYLVNSDGKVNNTIVQTPIDDFSSGLITHLADSFYINHTDAPSYIMRFENNLASSPYGIESLVNSNKLIDAGLTPNVRSAVDYIYYGAAVTTDCRTEEIAAEWFLLDYLPDPPDHLKFYNASCFAG